MSDAPKNLRPYLFHGLALEWKEGDEEALGTCPWCGREGKFSVNIRSGLWRCFTCPGEDRAGNQFVFLRRLWKESKQTTTEYQALQRDRRLLSAETLVEWGVARSMISGDWIVPGYTPEGNLIQLYRYQSLDGKRRLLATPTMSHGLFGVPHLYCKQLTVWLCEGVWDAMALWEVLRGTKQIHALKYAATANPRKSLLAVGSVLAVPGCNVWNDAWLPLFKDKVVYLLYDNDHPKKHPGTGREIAPAGPACVLKTGERIRAGGAREVKYLRWSEATGYDLALPSGADVRDCLTSLF